MAGNLTVTVNHDLCVGNGICPRVAPKVFALNDDRQSMVIDPDGEDRETVLDAAEACPVSAIFVADSQTGEQLFP